MAKAEGWQRSDLALPPDTTQAVLVWLADWQRHYEGRLPVLMTGSLHGLCETARY
jgi:hypothetical protein